MFYSTSHESHDFGIGVGGVPITRGAGSDKHAGPFDGLLPSGKWSKLDDFHCAVDISDMYGVRWRRLIQKGAKEEHHSGLCRHDG